MKCCTYLEMALKNKVNWIRETDGKLYLATKTFSYVGEITLGVNTTYHSPDGWNEMICCPFCGAKL